MCSCHMDLYNWYVNLLSIMSICPIIKYMIANNESNWTVKCSAPIETNHIQPYIGHAQLNIRQASPQCI